MAALIGTAWLARGWVFRWVLWEVGPARANAGAPPPGRSAGDVAVVVPQADGRLRRGVLVAQRAQGGRGEEEHPPRGRLPPAPTGGEDPEEVAAGEQQHVAGGGPEAGDHPVGAGGDGRDAFAAGAAVAEEL